MKRLRIALIGLGLVGLFLFLLLSWFNYFYLPKKARSLLIRELEGQTGLKAEVPRLSFHPLKGIALFAPKLRDPKEEKIRFQALRVYVKPSWIHLVFKRKFIASSVAFEKPSIFLIRYEDGRWNLQEFWKKKEAPSALARIPNIAITQGDLFFSDRAAPAPFSKHLTNVNATLSPRLTGSLAFHGSFGLQESPASFTFQGSHSLREETTSLKGVIRNFSISDLPPHLKKPLSFLAPEGEESVKEIQGNLTLKKDELVFEELRIALEEIAFFLQGKISNFQEPALDLTLNAQTDIQRFLAYLPQRQFFDPVSFEGPIGFSCHVQGRTGGLSLSGSLEARDLLAKDIPFFGEIRQLHGTIHFAENTLKTDVLKGNYQGLPFELKGSLTDFRNPLVDAELRFAYSLQELEKTAFFQTLPKNFHPTLEGLGQWDLKVKGPLRDLSQKNLSGTCRLQNASLRTPFLPSAVERIDGELFFDADTMTGKGITGIYEGSPFLLDGSLQKGQTPKVEFSLTTKTFQLSSDFTVHGKDLYPFRLTRKTPKTLLSVSGEILNYESPKVRLDGRWEGPVRELLALNVFGEKFPLTDAPQGHLATGFTLTGPKDEPGKIRVVGEFSSPLLRYKANHFKNVSSRYVIHADFLTLSGFSSTLFGGRLFGNAEIDLSDKRYRVDMELNQAKFPQVIHTFTSRHKGVQGLVSGRIQGEGKIRDAGSLAGEGWVKVEEGNLFQLAPLAKLTPVLRPFVSAIYPELDKITFRKAYAHFRVRDKVIRSENLMIQGEGATLYGEGAVGFDQSLDFHIWVQFTDPRLLERPTNIARLKNIFINEMGMLSGEVRVTGTLQEPKYRYVPLPLNRLQRILQDTGSIIFERLFE